jgi:hypothetical protein
MNNVHEKSALVYEPSTTAYLDKYFEGDGVIKKYEAVNLNDITIVTRTRRDTGSIFEKPEIKEVSNAYFLSELAEEWTEIVEIAEKLSRREKLTENDELWINELAEATGWDRNAICDELMNIIVDPSERIKKYKELHEKYFEEAKRLREGGDTRQAGEKLWGAVTALIKLYAAIKRAPTLHWSRGRLEKFVTNNVEEEYKALFRDLLDKTHPLHEHFYEAYLDEKSFDERWEEAIKLLERARKVVFTKLSQLSS